MPAAAATTLNGTYFAHVLPDGCGGAGPRNWPEAVLEVRQPHLLQRGSQAVHLHTTGVDCYNVSMCREGWDVSIVGSCVLDAVHMGGGALRGSVLRLVACIIEAIEALHMTAMEH
jgi:hypothetical protein